MRWAYIGQLEQGSTSRMRFEALQMILGDEICSVDLSPLLHTLKYRIFLPGDLRKVLRLAKSVNL